MRKIIIFLLTAAMLLSVVACTKNESKKPADTTSPETTNPQTTNPQTTIPQTTTLLDPDDPIMNELLSSKIRLRFNSNGEFRVLILADLHLQPTRLSYSMKKSVEMLLDREKPDLVIMTGDNVYGSTISNIEMFEDTLRQVADYLEERQIPWMHVYGNHDSEGAVSREEQQVIYESFDYCISKTGDDLTGVGNYAIPLLGSNSNELKFVFWGLDSGTYISEEDKINLLPNVPVFEGHVNSPYDYIHQDQIDWYASASAQIEEYTGGVKVPGLMAFHIPLQETYTAWLDRENLGYTGQKRDPVCASAYNSGLFDVICERGDIKAIINGHDHINDFMVNYKGVKLCYSSSFSTNTYNNVDMHGSRVFVIKESDPANIETYMSYVSDAADPSKVEPFEDGYTFDFENTATEFELTGWPYSTVPEYFISQIKADIIGGVGINGSNALGVTREQYHDDYRANNTEVRWEFERAGRIGENKYLMVWMDLSANNVDFRKLIFGLIANDAPSAPYTTDNHDVPSSFYYKAEGSDEWVELKTGNDGCIGVAQDTPLSGYKGWFAFPIEYMPNSTSNGATINENTIITGVYFYMCLASSDMAGKYVYIDNVSFVKELK